MPHHERYMYRCLQLALMGEGRVAPNPMVGSVLVHENRIIGEGWHRQYGGPHAEVNCIASVMESEQHLIKDATIYVSLEPCAHFGKTPPCADLIIKHGIKKVVVGCRDPFPLVAGKGIEKLQVAGCEVLLGVLEQDCLALNKRFFCVHTLHRPYITLKWAQTGDGKIGTGYPVSQAAGLQERDTAATKRLMISGPQSNRLVHRWRSQEAAILVGTQTALADNPSLTTRLWPGPDPIRLVADLHGRLPHNLHLFNGSVPTIVFSLSQHTLTDAASLRHTTGGVFYYQVSEDASLVQQILNALYQLQIQSLFVEGGARMLQSFIDEDVWDEARTITNESLMAGDGLDAPLLAKQQLLHMEQLEGDTIRYFRHL